MSAGASELGRMRAVNFEPFISQEMSPLCKKTRPFTRLATREISWVACTDHHVLQLGGIPCLHLQGCNVKRPQFTLTTSLRWPEGLFYQSLMISMCSMHVKSRLYTWNASKWVSEPSSLTAMLTTPVTALSPSCACISAAPVHLMRIRQKCLFARR